MDYTKDPDGDSVMKNESLKKYFRKIGIMGNYEDYVSKKKLIDPNDNSWMTKRIKDIYKESPEKTISIVAH